MKIRLIALISALAFCISASAQQTIGGRAQIISPEINPDGTVTFRYRNPKAVTVQLSGDFLPDSRPVDLVEQDGIWTYTTAQIVPPEFYCYNYIVDGTRTLDPNNAQVDRDIATLSNVLIVPGGIADNYMVNDVPHGTVSKVWYESGIGKNRRMTVYTPAGYESNSRTRYPVLYVLHGIGGDEEAWMDHGCAARILDNAIASGRAKPMIVVFPNGNMSEEAAPFQNSTGYDRPTAGLPMTMEGTFESYFPEIVKFVDSRYRTLARKDSRAICGLSMGGFHSCYISLNYPDMFNYIGLFSAAIGVAGDREGKSPIYQDIDKKLELLFSKKPALYWIGIGKDDFLYRSNAAFKAKLEEAGYPYEYMETDGGHIWKNWRIYLDTFIQKLFR